MIVAISSVKNEAEIIAKTISHLRGEGVDDVYVSVGASTDTTYDEVWSQTDMVFDQEGPFDQSAEMTRLAHMAAADHADWIIPFDADEFWIGSDGRTIAEVLGELPPNVVRVHAPVYTHLDYSTMISAPKLWGKVAFRPHDPMHLSWGNHHVDNGPGDAEHGILAIRELQYRSYDHFLAKIQKSRELFASYDFPAEHGSHMRYLTMLDPSELPAAYASHVDAESEQNPIPYRGTVPWT